MNIQNSNPTNPNPTPIGSDGFIKLLQNHMHNHDKPYTIATAAHKHTADAINKPITIKI